MRRCLQLAAQALGDTYPNPVVGCVIVYKGRIIGEGWHHKAGQPHAEVMAVNQVKDKKLLSSATVYVSLEPCNHQGKTPACVDLLLQYQITKVIVGTVDPNPLVAGQGIRRLQTHGINVSVGCLEKACQDLNKRFFTFQKKKRPFVVLKWAESADGFLAPETESRAKDKPFWLSNSFSRQWVHQRRSKEHAILIGAQTLRDDNPKLNVRLWQGSNPIPIILSHSKNISNNHSLSSHPQLLCLDQLIDFNKPHDFRISIAELMSTLYQKNIQSVLVEGGRQVLLQFLAAGVWDEIYVIETEKRLGSGLEAPQKPMESLVSKKELYQDKLLRFKNTVSGSVVNFSGNA